MTRQHGPGLWAVAAFALFVGTPARADVITNGGFEAGFAGWTRVDRPGSDGTFFLQSGGQSPLLNNAVPPPPAGLRAAMTDAFGPGSHVLYQDFVVPNSVPAAVLQFSLFVGNRDTAFRIPATAGLDFSTPQLNQQARVDLLRAGADPFSVAPADVLQTLYQTRPGDPLVNGYFSVSADVRAVLAANPGQTLRLRFAEVDNVNTFQFGVDNVTLATPEPASVTLFGVAAVVGLARLARRKPRPTPTD